MTLALIQATGLLASSLLQCLAWRHRRRRLRALARWILSVRFAAALVPSVLCLARKVSAFGRADVLVSPEPEGLRVRRVGDSAVAFRSQGRRSAAPRRRRPRRGRSGDPSRWLAERSAELTVLRGDALRTFRNVPVSSWDWRYLFLFAVGLAFLAAGFAAVRPSPPSRESLLFAGFALSVGLVLTLTPVPPVDGLFRAAVLLEDARARSLPGSPARPRLHVPEADA